MRDNSGYATWPNIDLRFYTLTSDDDIILSSSISSPLNPPVDKGDEEKIEYKCMQSRLIFPEMQIRPR